MIYFYDATTTTIREERGEKAILGRCQSALLLADSLIVRVEWRCSAVRCGASFKAIGDRWSVGNGQWAAMSSAGAKRKYKFQVVVVVYYSSSSSSSLLMPCHARSCE